MKAFISYSSLDAVVADEIVKALESHEIDCFIAPRDIRTGHVYAEEIIYGIETAEVVVLVLTENSNNSQHVLREIERAVSTKIPIISYRSEELKLIPAMEYFLMSNQWLDNPWNGKHDELITAVKELAKKNQQDKSDEPKSEVSRNHAAIKRMKRKKNVWKVIAIAMVAIWMITMCIILGVNHLREAERLAQEAAIAAPKPVELEVGDVYAFGNYLGENVEWWVVDVNDGIATLLAKNVICMKGFEGAESGHNFYTISGETKAPDRPFTEIENMEAFGSNDWEKSSLRAWLNSSRINVEYIGQIPTASSMCDGRNEYNSEAGFLHDFSQEEMDALVATTVSTEFHDWESGRTLVKETEDYVYIPSKADIPLFETVDINIFCEPTASAIEKDNSNMYQEYCELYDLTTTVWWLRDPYENSYSELCCVATGHNAVMFVENVAAVPGVGVRPMLRVDISKLVAK